MKRYFWPLLACIFLLGLLVRTVDLSNYPAGFTPDEAAFGYNAYSLFTTGHDEWGTSFLSLPFVGLRSFGDYKLPLYSFLTVPVITIFGINEFSVRLPNALISSLSIFALGILVYRLTRNRYLLLFSSLLLAISPWSVPISRGAFEANLTVSFLIIALSLAASRHFRVAAIVFALGMYTYHTGRLLTPLVFAGSLYTFFPHRRVFRYVGIFLLLTWPAFYSLVAFNARSADISIMNPADGWESMATKRLRLIESGWSEPWARLASNKITSAGQVFISNYLSYFTPRFLFISGPGESTYGMLPGHGVTYFPDLLLIPLGIWYLIRRKSVGLWMIVSLLVFLTPIPASLTKGSGFAANRAAPLVIPLVLLSAFGLEVIRKNTKNRLIPAILLIVLILLSVNTFNFYRVHQPEASARSMGYGWRQAAPIVLSAGQLYSEVRVSRALSEPHIYLAYYSAWPPGDYQTSSAYWSEFEELGFRFLDQYDGYWLGNFRFGDLNFDRPVSFPVLYIGRPADFPKGTDYQVLSSFPDGVPAIVAVVGAGIDNLSFQL